MVGTNFYTEIGKNKRDSVILIVFIFLILLAFAYVFSEMFVPQLALIIILIIGILVIANALFSYYHGDTVVIKTTGAKPADPIRHAYLINTVEGLSLAAGLPKPKIYIIPNKDINAFATGRDPEHASVAVTQGALDHLNRQELEGVLAHEMSHIGNYDIRFALLVAVFVGLIAILSHVLLRSFIFSGGSNRKGEGGGALIVIGLVLAIVAPIVVRLTQLAISRRREYLADATGAKLTRYPPGLASALAKIQKYNSGKMEVNEAVSHLFIADPKKSFADNLMATHPPIEKRIEKLNAM